MSTLGKPQRQHRILRILEEQPVSSQTQLVQMLEAEGIVATQATVSRDLEDLGAVKVRIPGGAMAYAIPDFTRERAPSDDHLKRLMSEFVVEVAHSANLVVLRTPPGARTSSAARSTARRSPTVLGTVAGDDTVLVVCKESAGGATRRRRARRPRGRLGRQGRNDRGEACRARVLGRPRHLGRRALDARGVGRRGHRVRGRRRPARPRAKRRRSASGPRPRARSRSRSSTPATSSRDDFLVPALQANAMYEGKYPLVSALSRPVIVEHLVASAAPARRRRGRGTAAPARATTRCASKCRRASSRPTSTCSHRCACGALTRADCIELAAKWDIPISASKEKLYSIDENMWGRAIECGVLENPWSSPPQEPYTLTRSPKDAPREPRDDRRRVRARAFRCRSTARASASSSSSRRSARSSARTAGAASTWSRTGGSASRAARSTSARRRSR